LTQTVLVVDDSSFITEGLASILKKNYRTLISSGGEMCLELLRTETPDIIILDILMEPMDGWETLLHIRENPATCHIPVIMFSAKKISPFEAETHHPHIDDYITKPVNPRDLLDTIAKVLSRREEGKRNIELWKQAGMAAEMVEDYARLTAGIEVDRGLSSNLRQQLGMERRDGPLEEIQRTIGMIESRIRENTILAEDIAQRGHALIAAGAGPGAAGSCEDSAGTGDPSLPGAARSGSGCAAPAIMPDDQGPDPLPRGMDGRGTGIPPGPVPGQAGPDPANRPQDNAGETGTGAGTAIAPAETQKDPGAGRDFMHVPAISSSDEPAETGSPAGPHTQETIDPPHLPVTILAESLSGDDPDPGPAPQIPPAPVQFPVIADGSGDNGVSPPVTETPARAPQSPGQPADPPRPEQDRGSPDNARNAGSAGSTPLNGKPGVLPGRNFTRPVSPQKASSPGFFAQILAAIRNLFSRSKP